MTLPDVPSPLLPMRLRPDRPRLITLLLAYTFHCYGRTEGVAGVIISDKDYPGLVAHQLLSKIVDEFLAAHPRTSFAGASPQSLEMPQLKEYIVKYQDPQQADSIMKIQRELDETKIVLHKTIESVLERGEKIDTLVEKSNDLSAQSRMFYGQVCRYRPRPVHAWYRGRCDPSILLRDAPVIRSQANPSLTNRRRSKILAVL